MEAVKKHLDLLGHLVEDKVTGFKGIVASINFELYGCIQAVVNPGVDKDGNIRDSRWFDVNRLRVLSSSPVMNVPNFGQLTTANGDQGADEKPLFDKP